MLFPDLPRKLMEECDNIRRMMEVAPVQARLCEEANYVRRMTGAMSSAQFLAMQGALADATRAMNLHDEMLRSMRTVLDADLPPRTDASPPLTTWMHDTPSRMKQRIERLEREVQELKDRLNPRPPPPPRKDGESSAGGQYL
jgi:hypothetical protein